MKDILERLLAGDFSVDEALLLLRAERVESVGELARLDPDRMQRKGVPEVINAGGKSPAVTAELATRMLEAIGLALVSRVSEAHHTALLPVAEAAGVGLEVFGGGRRLRQKEPAVTGGRIGILCAGTADIDVAEEARMMAESMGVGVRRAYDVGVAALHRLAEPLAALVAEDVDAVVVVAGMEGALPSVVGGLVSMPVIAVPTSTGYGAGGKGLAALLGMLQSCSPGITVVNIDNGIGAGASAALIANRARATRGTPA